MVEDIEFYASGMSSRRGSRSSDGDILAVTGGIIGNGVPAIQMGEAEASVGTPVGASRSQTPSKSASR